MTTDQLLTLGRVTERLLICLFAGLSLTLGWNLFRVGVLDQQSASLDIKGWRIDLKRVGPGIFFALFGAAVLAFSLRSPLKLGAEQQAASATGQPLESKGAVQYDVSVDSTLAKRWVASLNTVLEIAPPDKFQSSEKTAIARSEIDLTNLRNTLVIRQFGGDRFTEYEAKKDRFATDPTALSPSERGRVEEIATWMNGTRNLE